MPIPPPIHEYETDRGFHVIKLHVSADPDKASDEWRAAKRKKLGRLFDREIDMNFGVEVGSRIIERVFEEHREEIVIDPLWIHPPPGLSAWASIDWGLDKPTSVHEYIRGNGAGGTKTGHYYVTWEFYMKHLKDNPSTVIEAIKRRGMLDRYRHFWCDPSMRNRTQVVGNVKSAVSVAFWFHQKGIVLTPAMDKSDKTAIIKLTDLILLGRFHIFRSCPSMIDELPNLIFNPETELITSRKNHAFDDLKYFLLSQNEITSLSTKKEPKPGEGMTPTERWLLKQHEEFKDRFASVDQQTGQWVYW